MDDVYTSWVGKFLEREQFEVKTPLYHYTTAAGLQGILEKGEMWFTNALHLNDPSEMLFGLDIARDLFPKIGEKSKSIDRLVYELYKLLGLQHFQEHFVPYFTCFSEDRNELGQWRAYGDNGRGFAIGLKPSVFKIVQTQSSEPDETFIAKVQYISRDGPNPFEKSIPEFLDFMKDMPDESSFGLRRDALTILILWHAITVKHIGYKNEREVRLIIHRDAPQLARFVRTRIRGSSLVPFIVKGIEANKAENIHEIVVGPAADPGAVHALKLFLQSKSLGEVSVTKSDIPYRAL